MFFSLDTLSTYQCGGRRPGHYYGTRPTDQGLDSDITIDLGDTAVNGERTITISDYMDAAPENYVADGLVLRLDGIEPGDKAEEGLWQNLAKMDEYVTLNDERLPEDSGNNVVGPNTFGDNYMHFNLSGNTCPPVLRMS